MSAPRSGSSPLTRGKPATYQVTAKLGGLIPAHAGKTTAPPAWGGRGPAHPRSRGENSTGSWRWSRSQGSSPLTRGKLGVGHCAIDCHGLIPAHAGKTSSTGSPGGPRWAHPRSRGENVGIVRFVGWGGGSSPLTRGKPPVQERSRHAGGLIPAHAGKTLIASCSPAPIRAHPRSRGENALGRRSRLAGWGSSPLTRGKPGPVNELAGVVGLIPAHAGKTRPCLRAWRWSGAHPRSRGENGFVAVGVALGGGSSPLTRGKLCPRAGGQDVRGLIPAHAGKTSLVSRMYPSSTAHPRSRGENSASLYSEPPALGSSPLTRGKLAGVVRIRHDDGLIPAHAGKTHTRRRSTACRWAHPRSRGENDLTLASLEYAEGSSPLTRGKRPRRGRLRVATWAHPRSRGENSIGDAHGATPNGSSPLTRGKPR